MPGLKGDVQMRDYTVGELVERLIVLRDINKGTLTREELDTIADACNVLSHGVVSSKRVSEVVYSEENTND